MKVMKHHIIKREIFSMTHDQLVDIGYRWVIKRCGFAFKELKTIEKEIPDVIGFRSEGTFLLEAKATRKDFLSDKNKPFRKEGGMGDWRFYIAPKGIIDPNELPDGWGLIHVDKGKARVEYNPFGRGNIYSRWNRNEPGC
jgi:hypothetical protein